MGLARLFPLFVQAVGDVLRAVIAGIGRDLGGCVNAPALQGRERSAGDTVTRITKDRRNLRVAIDH
jgi:hypothetical protein